MTRVPTPDLPEDYSRRGYSWSTRTIVIPSFSVPLCLSLFHARRISVSLNRAFVERKKKMRTSSKSRGETSRTDRRTIELDSAREKEKRIREREGDKSGLRTDSTRNINDRETNVVDPASSLFFCLSLTLSLSLPRSPCRIFLTPAALERTCPKQTFFPPCPGFMSTDRGQKAARVLTKRTESSGVAATKTREKTAGT